MIYILTFALLVRLALFIRPTIPLRSDSLDYHGLAISLTKGQYFVEGTQLDQFRTPGYPFFISVVYRIFGISPRMVVLFQIFVNSKGRIVRKMPD